MLFSDIQDYLVKMYYDYLYKVLEIIHKACQMSLYDVAFIWRPMIR